MPVFNWVALKPNQINGTVFNEIDDERILEVPFSLVGNKEGCLGAELKWVLCEPGSFSDKMLVF